jgi:hypothetical protein
MPTFLYPYLTLNLLLLLNNFKGFLRQAIFGLITLAITAVFYLPVIAVNGTNVLLQSRQSDDTSRWEVLGLFSAFASKALVEVTGISFPVIVLLSLAAVLVMVIQKRQFGIKLAAAFIVGPLLLTVLHPVIPFARTFSYYCIVLPFLCIIPLNSFLEKFHRKYIITAVLFVQVIFLYSFFYENEIA